MDRPRWVWAPKAATSDAARFEYLYVPCPHNRQGDYSAETRRWVQEVPIVRKTAKWIYYASDSWNRRDTHPDRGGTVEQFIDARRRYQTALRPSPAA